MLLLIGAIFFYLLIHGTNNLAIVEIINSIVPIISKFRGTRIQNLYIQCYLVDCLWFTSFATMVSIIYPKNYIILTLFFAIILEILQLLFPKLGTFDFFDIFLYIIISGIFLFFRKLSYLIIKFDFSEKFLLYTYF